LRDLGYYDLKEYQRIREIQAFYVTRIKANTKLSTKNNTPETFENTGKPKKYSQFQVIDLEQLVDDMFPGETREFPEVYCGRAHYLGDRLIVHKLSEEEYKQRQNQLRRLEQKRKPISPKSERIKQLSVYMTNCPASMISNEQVHELYSLRWQIELLFKTWKSIFGINQVKKMNVNRLKCAIYGKLIAIFILSSTMFEIRQILYDKQKNEISEQKALRVLKLYLIDFQDAFLKHVSALQTLVDRLILHIGKTCKKSHKSGKSTCLDILLTLNCV
ncbi:IS4 family transposase, partial [Enterococcus faecalis]|uniref:IS4 family transposase n=1 Tax=Enterococcus faecalis TaxID=1351 RepID=UPI003D0C1A41